MYTTVCNCLGVHKGRGRCLKFLRMPLNVNGCERASHNDHTYMYKTFFSFIDMIVLKENENTRNRRRNIYMYVKINLRRCFFPRNTWFIRFFARMFFYYIFVINLDSLGRQSLVTLLRDGELDTLALR